MRQSEPRSYCVILTRWVWVTSVTRARLAYFGQPIAPCFIHTYIHTDRGTVLLVLFYSFFLVAEIKFGSTRRD